MKISNIYQRILLALILCITLVSVHAQIDCWDPSKKNRDTDISLQVYGGGDLVGSSLSVLDSDFDFLLNERENSSTFIGGYKAGVMLKYHFVPRLYIKGGVEHKNFTERFDYEISEEVTEVLMDQVVSIEIDENGNETEILGDLLVTQTETTIWEMYNTFKMYNIVGMVGYRLIDGGRFTMNIEGGLSYNVSFNHDGTNLDVNLVPQVVDDSYYNGFTGVDFLGGIDFGLALSEKVRLFSALQGKVIPSSIAHNANPVDQKLSFVGAAIGLEFMF